MFSSNRTNPPKSRLLRALGTLAVACLAVLPARAADLSAALDAVAADAQMVIVIPSMQDASTAVADLAAMFGVDDPEMADPLGAFKNDMNLANGLDDDGPAIIVFTDLVHAIETGEEPKPVMLMPVSDYAAFVTQLGGTDGGVTEIEFDYDKGFAKQMAGYAVMGEDAATVEAYAAGDAGAKLLDRVGAYAQDAAGDALVAVYIDVAALAPALKEKIDEGVQEAQASIERAKENGEQMPPMVEAMDLGGIMAAYGDLGKTLLDGVDAFMFSASYNDEGLGIDEAVKVVEGSTLAGYLTGEAGDFDHLLSEMPDQPYLMASAFDMKSVKLKALVTDLMNGVQAAAGDSPLVAGWLKAVGQTMDIYDQLGAGAQTFYAPDMAAMMTGGFFKTLSIYEVDDADAAIASWKQSVVAMPGIVAELGEDAGGISFDVVWTDNALALDGHDVHQYQVNVILPPEMMQEMGPAAMMMGNSGYGGYVAGVGERMLITTVPDPQLIQKGIAAVEAGNGLGAAGVVDQARTHLPEKPVMEAFVSLDGIATAANPFLMMFLAGQQIAVPADLPPLSMGVGIDGRAVGFRAFVPNEAMLFVRDTVEQMQAATQLQQQQQQGGGQRAPF